MRAWADVAVLAKTKNLQGGFVARAAAGLPFLLHEGLEVAFVPPALDAPRRARVASVQQSGDGFLVFFDGIDGIDVAERLAGCHCLVRTDDVPEGSLAAADDGVLGWEVFDAAAGCLGTVVEVVENPGQSLLSIERAGDARPLLVPAVDAFVVGLDERARRIDVDVPAGLLDL